MPKIKIAPSILSADLSKVNQEIKEVERYADMIHVDIMDGVFVPPTTVNADFVKTIKTKLPLDVHLMVHEPSYSYIKGFVDAGAYSITIHEEACKDLSKQIGFIKKNGIKAGISIKPNTSLDKLKKYLEIVDMVLVMTVEPGIYIASDSENVPPKYLGIGVRIEDNVLVTESGCEILTATVPKTIDGIEQLMRQAGSD